MRPSGGVLSRANGAVAALPESSGARAIVPGPFGRKPALRIVPALVLALMNGMPARAAGQVADPLHGFDAFVDSVRANWGAPGVAVAVVKDGAVVFSGGFGLRDLEAHLPVTARTVFSIGSTTKAFTAMTAAILVEDGVLRLDVPVQSLVSGFHLSDECAERRGTMRDLLSHRMGFPGYLDNLWFLSDLDRSAIFSRLASLETGPGFREEFRYSNLGYMAAGVVMEKLAGVPWERLVTDRILRPLGMDRSGFSVQVPAAAADVALPYRVEDGEPRRVQLTGNLAFDRMDVLGPAGSLTSTLEDMTRWVLVQLPGGRGAGRERLVSDATLAEMHNPETAIRDAGYRAAMQAEMYGLGWALSDYRGHRVVHHGGNIEGFSSVVSLMPDLDLGVVVLSNSLNLLGYVVSRNVQDRFLGSEQEDWDTPLRELYAQLAGAYTPAAAPPVSREESAPAGSFQDVGGEYRHPAFSTVLVSVRDDGLDLEFASGLRSRTMFTGEAFRGTTGELYLPQILVTFSPAGEPGPRELHLSFGTGTRPVVFRRAPAPGNAR